MECKRCGHVSGQRTDLIKHLRRKKTCAPTKEDIDVTILLDELLPTGSKEKAFQCGKCDKVYSTRQAKSRHMKTCISVDDSEKDNMLQRIVAMEEEIKILRAKTQSQENNCINNTHNINNGTVINQHVQINGLGRENIRYITQDPKFCEFMTACIKGKMNGLMDYMVRKHFDPKHPENHNVRKLNKKEDFMEVYDGMKWRTQYSDEILEDVFHHMQTDFANFVDEALTEDGVIKKVWLDNFMDKVGAPLEWDLYSEAGYEYDKEMTDEQKEAQKLRIYKLACRYVYDNSCQLQRI
jgi:uncharacterized C2H2 Zn-finger protein